jgi:GNAT superfamily N-acetyltransferase
MSVRAADGSEIDALARLWHDGWQDAHAAIVPEALARARTLSSFAGRLRDAQADLRVIGPVGSPLGFHLLKADELYQFYVAAAARGQGVAQELIADAETCLAAQGHAIAWLACAIGNERAARFYEKCGWRRSGNFVSRLETADGPFDLEVWRYEKRVGAA